MGMLIGKDTQKWIEFIFLILLIVTNLILVFKSGIYVLLLLIQIAFYFLVFFGFKLNKPINLNKPNRPAKLNKLMVIPYPFVLVNLSYLKGWLTYLLGEKYTKWEPERGS